MSLSLYPKVLSPLVLETAVEGHLKPADCDSFESEVDDNVNHSRDENSPSVPIVAFPFEHKGYEQEEVMHGFHVVADTVGKASRFVNHAGFWHFTDISGHEQETHAAGDEADNAENKGNVVVEGFSEGRSSAEGKTSNDKLEVCNQPNNIGLVTDNRST